MNLDVLKSLSLDAWYKVFVVVGIAGVGYGLVGDPKGITNGQLLLFGSGLFLWGTGVWIDTNKESLGISPPNAYTGGVAREFYANKWRPSLLGILFVLIGLGLIGVGVWQIPGIQKLFI